MYIDDRTRVLHILRLAHEATAFTVACRRTDLDSNRMLYHAVNDCVATASDAAYALSNGYRREHSEVAWEAVIRFRHRLDGERFVDSDAIWNFVTNDLPRLVGQLESFADH